MPSEQTPAQASDLIERLQSHMGKADMGEVLADCRLAADRISSLEAEVAGLRDVVLVSERFLNACNSAWASGEPAHRVITMVNLADELRAALLNRGET